MKALLIAALAIFAASSPVVAQETPMQNRIDLIRPDAPELAPYGEYAIGVRTVDLVNKGQPDILKVEAGKPVPSYDRKLTIEIWYPADTAVSQRGVYDVLLRDGKTRVKLSGRAARDAAPKKTGGPFPLVIISHGYPGNRFLMSHLGENLASKGYVVASIDHAESTYDDMQKFGSTLVNRPIDQKFVLNEMQRLSAEKGFFLEGLIDASNTGLIGYSMGGYGALITAGAGVTKASTEFPWGAPEKTLEVNMAGTDSMKALLDDRFKAIIAVAPWGMQRGFWDADALANIKKPLFIIGGSVDDVADYKGGIHKIYEGAVNSDRYMLTFVDANHNAAAPIPAPVESWNKVEGLSFVPFDHYADAVWDSVRMNNIFQHFATAFLGEKLKGEAAMGEYLALKVENANDAVFAVNEDKTFKPEHNYWKGFQDRTAKGLILEHAAAKP